jgi:hypothetical protein
MNDDEDHDCHGCDIMRDKGVNGTCPEYDAEFDFDEIEPPKTAREIIADANALAREFYRLRGYVEREGYRFDKATHPQERECWLMVEAAYDHLAATELSEVLNEMEDE